MSQWNIGKKIAAGVLLILVQALSVGMFGLWLSRRTATELNVLASDHLVERSLAAQIERELLNARIYFIYFVTIQKEGTLPKGWERFRNAQRELPKLQEVVNGSTVLGDLRPDVEQLTRDFNSYVPALDHIIGMVQNHQNRGPAFDATMKEWARLGGAMVDSAGRLSQHGSGAADDLIAKASSQMHAATIVLSCGCITALLLGLAMGLVLTRNISGALRQITGRLGEAAGQVAHASSQISGSAQSLAQGASQQAASLEETSASSEEIHSMATRNRENAVAAAGNMAEAAERIEEANRNLQQMVVSMREMNASSDRISKIIKVIDEIAFQTNILALNAAVEAARAGEAGMGFAVVAEEVRNLAQRSAQAAKDTAGLIEESISRSHDGKNKLDLVTAAVRSITGSAEKVKVLVDQVKAGSEEQSRGIEQVAKSLVQIESVTQTTAANAQDNAAASDRLNAQSETLRAVVARLESMIGGTAGAGASIHSS